MVCVGLINPKALCRASDALNNGIFYMLGDHLGSTSVLLNQDGTVAKQEYYYPFGGNRGSAFSNLTTKRFTGQYHEAGLPGGQGLSYYYARWYDAQIGRFISADTLIPNPADPQSFNRLSYVQNNPLRFTDPSGHIIFPNGDGGGGHPPTLPEGRYYHVSYANGTYFDNSHISSGFNRAQRLLRDIRNAIANGGDFILIQSHQRQEVLGRRIIVATYRAEYWVSGSISESQIENVAWEIYRDYSFGWELWQGSIPLPKGRISSFSIEDFPSDRVGFMAAVRGVTPALILNELGSVRAASNSEIPRSDCTGSVCDRMDVKNHDFLDFSPKTNVNGQWVNVPWPANLQIAPLEESNLWSFQRDGTCWGNACLWATPEFFYDTP